MIPMMWGRFGFVPTAVCSQTVSLLPRIRHLVGQSAWKGLSQRSSGRKPCCSCDTVAEQVAMWKLWPNLKEEESWDWQLRAAAWVFRFHDRVTDPKHTMEGRKAPVDRMAMVFASVSTSAHRSPTDNVIDPKHSMKGWKAPIHRTAMVFASAIASTHTSSTTVSANTYSS